MIVASVADIVIISLLALRGIEMRAISVVVAATVFAAPHSSAFSWTSSKCLCFGDWGSSESHSDSALDLLPVGSSRQGATRSFVVATQAPTLCVRVRWWHRRPQPQRETQAYRRRYALVEPPEQALRLTLPRSEKLSDSGVVGLSHPVCPRRLRWLNSGRRHDSGHAHPR